MDHIVVLDDTHLAYWAEHETEIRRFTAPDEQAVGIEPATGIVTKPRHPTDLAVPTVRVAWRPSADDIENLRTGGVVWLSTWGGLPPHQLEVQPPSDLLCSYGGCEHFVAFVNGAYHHVVEVEGSLRVDLEDTIIEGHAASYER